MNKLKFAVGMSGPELLILGAAMCVSVWAGDAISADLDVAASDYYRGGVCYNFNLHHPEELHSEIAVRMRDYFEEANAVVVSAQQSQIVQLRFDWALETRDWCGVAIGYMKDAVWDNEAVNRCLCFREYMRDY